MKNLSGITNTPFLFFLLDWGSPPITSLRSVTVGSEGLGEASYPSKKVFTTS